MRGEGEKERNDREKKGVKMYLMGYFLNQEYKYTVARLIEAC